MLSGGGTVGQGKSSAILVLLLTMIAWTGASCGASGDESSIRVVVADDQVGVDQLVPGGPLSGGTITLYQGDIVVLEHSLDRDGRATISAPPGSYTIQAFFRSSDPGCFWGDTLYDVELPQEDLFVEVSQICSGS